jgi:hypothetical protein
MLFTVARPDPHPEGNREEEKPEVEFTHGLHRISVSLNGAEKEILSDILALVRLAKHTRFRI